MTERQRQTELKHADGAGSIRRIWTTVRSPAFSKPFLSVGVTFGIAQMTGIGNLFMYMVNIFQVSLNLR